MHDPYSRETNPNSANILRSVVLCCGFNTGGTRQGKGESAKARPLIIPDGFYRCVVVLVPVVPILVAVLVTFAIIPLVHRLITQL